MTAPRRRSRLTDGDVVTLENLLLEVEGKARGMLTRETRGRQHASWAGFVLAHGLRWMRGSPYPATMKPGEGGQCYRDALYLALSHGLVYVEGYALHEGKVGAHAWCAGRDGSVIDPTWRVPLECAYIGVPLQLDAVVAWARKTGRHALFREPANGLLDGRLDPRDFVAGEHEGYLLAWAAERDRRVRGRQCD